MILFLVFVLMLFLHADIILVRLGDFPHPDSRYCREKNPLQANFRRRVYSAPCSLEGDIFIQPDISRFDSVKRRNLTMNYLTGSAELSFTFTDL